MRKFKDILEESKLPIRTEKEPTFKRYCISYDADSLKDLARTDKVDSAKIKELIVTAILQQDIQASIHTPVESTIVFDTKKLNRKFIFWREKILDDIGNYVYYYMCQVALAQDENNQTIAIDSADRVPNLDENFQIIVDRIRNQLRKNKP